MYTAMRYYLPIRAGIIENRNINRGRVCVIFERTYCDKPSDRGGGAIITVTVTCVRDVLCGHIILKNNKNVLGQI